MPIRDVNKKRSYQRAWLKARRDDWIKEHGPCAKCGGSERLQIDHINPDEKSCEPSRLWTRTESIRKAELSKCQVLCEQCHKEKTRDDWASKMKHGTTNCYRAGCRCDECRSANTLAQRDRRIRKLKEHFKELSVRLKEMHGTDCKKTKEQL